MQNVANSDEGTRASTGFAEPGLEGFRWSSTMGQPNADRPRIARAADSSSNDASDASCEAGAEADEHWCPDADALSPPMTAERFAAGIAAVALADDQRLGALIARLVARDERALTEFYDDTVRRVYAVVLRFTQDAALAEEVVEDAYWQAWCQAPRFDPARGRPLSWLLSIARSRAVDAWRRNRRFDLQVAIDADEWSEHTAADASTEPPALLDAAGDAQRLHRALARLKSWERELLVLAYFSDLTHDEIARRTLLPLGTVKTRIRRSLLQLRAWLSERPGAGGDASGSLRPSGVCSNLRP